VIILVRHGQTDLNATGRLQGRVDAPLTDVGRGQAAAIAAAVLGGRRPARVISSPLRRARATAELLGLEVEVDERWIELDYGDWDGRPLRSIAAGEWDRWKTDPAFAPPEGESLVELGRRVTGACEDLVHVAAEDDVVVVSHVSPMKAAVGWALGVGPEVSWRMFLGVAAICRISVGPNGPSLYSFNELSHLGGGTVSSVTTTTLSVPAIHCDNCKNSIEGALRDLDGVVAADVSVADKTVTVVMDEGKVELAQVREAIEDQGFDVD
jgi:broad specificity phosphatase PhoE